MCYARLGEVKAKNCYERAVEWMKERKGHLAQIMLEELNQFQAEAKETLAVHPEKPTSLFSGYDAALVGSALPCSADELAELLNEHKQRNQAPDGLGSTDEC